MSPPLVEHSGCIPQFIDGVRAIALIPINENKECRRVTAPIALQFHFSGRVVCLEGFQVCLSNVHVTSD